VKGRSAVFTRLQKRFALGNSGLMTMERAVLITVEDEDDYTLVLVNLKRDD
jgi:hypothetical protein